MCKSLYINDLHINFTSGEQKGGQFLANF